MNDSSIKYGEFTIERDFKAPVARVFEMFADTESKEKWFKGPNGKTDHRMDFRVGGEEFNSGAFHDGITHIFKAHYYDIILNQRIIYAYEMYLNEKRISVSLATIEFIKTNDGTRLILYENGAFWTVMIHLK